MYTYNEIVNDTSLQGVYSPRPYTIAGIVLVLFTLIVLLSLMFTPAIVSSSTTPNDPYSYHAFMVENHVPVPPCTMSVTVDTGITYCAETGKLPTRSQSNVWEGYVLWHSCYADHDQLSCSQLNQ